MNTVKLYQKNVYLKEFDAKITSLHTDGEDIIITLDQTAFFPTGGGQSCDRGNISGFEVTDVYEENGHIFHRLKSGASAGNLCEGDAVSGQIDWEHRFDNMQRHCGEHILSGMFFREYGGVNRGFHMGDEYMTIDISLEEKPEYKEVTWEMAQHVELCTNEAIWSNTPVITRHFDRREEAENLPLRKALAFLLGKGRHDGKQHLALGVHCVDGLFFEENYSVCGKYRQSVRLRSLLRHTPIHRRSGGTCQALQGGA